MHMEKVLMLMLGALFLASVVVQHAYTKDIFLNFLLYDPKLDCTTHLCRFVLTGLMYVHQGTFI
jgi:hypothetical protein